MSLTTCKICLTEHFDELPCPNCETSIDLSEVEEAKPIGFISDETRQWLLDENGRGPGMFTPNRNGAGGVWAIYGGWEYKRLLTIAKNLQKQCVLMHGVVAAARTLYEETEEYDFPDGMGKGALQEYWDALADALEPELDAALKAAQPEYPSTADDEATRWRHGEPSAISDERIDIVFDGPPSHESGRFVEVENAQGKSIKFGEWVRRPDGYWALRFSLAATQISDETVRVPREPTPEMLDAICSVRFKQGAEMYREIYKTMLAAAPKEAR